MSELFARVAENELLVRGPDAFQELRFNGDRAAFVSAEFGDFYSLLASGHVVWLSDMVAAFTDPLADDSLLLKALRRRTGDDGTLIYHLEFDNLSFPVICLHEPTLDETSLFDMLINCQSRRHKLKNSAFFQ
jgi:hypothetical protein